MEVSKSHGLTGGVTERGSGFLGMEIRIFLPALSLSPLPSRRASSLGSKLWRPSLQAPESSPPCPLFPSLLEEGGEKRAPGAREGWEPARVIGL